METNPSVTIQSIDASTLTPIVCRSLRRENIRILDWNVVRLGGGAGNPVSVGLYRFEGMGQGQDEYIPWSVILKIIQSPSNVNWVDMGEGDDQTHWNYWKREPLVYQSHLLEDLPEGMMAPRCFNVTELPGQVFWLWLEDIVDSYEGEWPLDRYALTARHLGRLNGMYLTQRPMPAFPWLSMHRVRQWVTSMPWQTTPWEHPRVLARYPKPEVNTFRHMLIEHERFLAKLELLPRTISHGDTYPTNFKSRHSDGQQEQTVALDWALMGIAPLGDDLGQFVFGTQTILKDTDRVAVDRVLFENYIKGLRDFDCQVDPRWVRFGYTTLAALRVGLFQLFLLGEDIQRGDVPAETDIEHPDFPRCFEVMMADEAFKLLEVIQ
jgi:hypothetical protein